jgi:hypothetical protein
VSHRVVLNTPFTRVRVRKVSLVMNYIHKKCRAVSEPHCLLAFLFRAP